ncbi:MAG: FecR family protein [Gammaproteobacteria bacterium]|jgi:ferric-dicitrate binding protein FerR (iron transport regulator)
MHETNGENTPDADPLAEILRAAGRRAAPPQEDYDQVFAAAHAAWRRKLKRRRHRNWYALAAAAALMAMGVTFWQSFQSAATPAAAEIARAQGLVEQFSTELDAWTRTGDAAPALTAGSRIRTGSDGATALQLADGGSLRLSANTELTLGGTSFELAYGTLYFDSAGRRAGLTIDVVTPLGTVRDIGTQFEVRTTPDALRVRIRSGSVALLESTAAVPVAGQSGEEIRLSAAGQISRREFARDDPEWAWAESLAVVPDFDAPSVLRYLRWIAQETGKTLEFESETVRLQAELARFLGDPAGLMPTELLITITATSDFNYEITDSGTILISRDTRPE